MDSVDTAHTVPKYMFFNICVHCTIGYNDFDLFDKTEPPRPEMDVNSVKRQICKRR